MKLTRYTRLYLLLAALPLLATGCSREQDSDAAPEQAVDFTRITTRTASGNSLPGDFADYGTLKARATATTGAAQTATLTYNNPSWTCTPQLYWQSTTQNTTIALWRGTDNDFTLPANLGDTNDSGISAYALHDRLWTNYVGLLSTSLTWELKHCMAQIRVELTVAKGVTLPEGSSLTSATVSMTLPTAGHFDTATGTVTRQTGNGTTGTVQFYQPNPEEAVFYAVALPGNTDTREISIKLGDQAYHYSASSSISLTAGTCHSYKLALTDRADVQALNVQMEGDWADVPVSTQAAASEYSCTTTQAGELATTLPKADKFYSKVIVNVAAMNDDDWRALVAFVDDATRPADLTINYTGSAELEISSIFSDSSKKIHVGSLTLQGYLKIPNNSFQGNYYLTKLVVGKQGDAGKACTIGASAFNSCTSLREVILEEGLTTIGESAFEGLNLTGAVTIPSSVTTFGESSFKGTKLTSVTLPDKLTTISNSAFEDCKQLTSITIPSSVTYLGDSSFKGSGLTMVTLPDKLATIGHYAFQNCTTLGGSITIPSTVTSIGELVFAGTALTSVYIYGNVTWNSTGLSNSNAAFNNCIKLETIVLGSVVTSLGSTAFRGCTALKKIVLNGTSDITCPDGWSGVFANVTTANVPIYLYGSVNASQAGAWRTSLDGKTWKEVHYGFSGTASNIEDLLDDTKYRSVTPGN